MLILDGKNEEAIDTITPRRWSNVINPIPKKGLQAHGISLAHWAHYLVWRGVWLAVGNCCTNLDETDFD